MEIIIKINLVLGLIAFIISILFVYKLYLGAKGTMPRGGVLIYSKN